MCGVAGYIANQHYEDDLSNAVLAMIHRGPDSNHTKELEFLGKKIGLGHVRLRILDLDFRSDQPFTIDDGLYTIVYNGEIYNYVSIKEDLIELGVQFYTTSDTEVFLQAYKHYGIKCVDKFKGIFSAVIIDAKRDEIHLVRDQLGVKPLYYYKNAQGELFFASEIKSLFQFKDIKQTISQSNICQFLNMGFVIEPDTGFEDVKKVLPGAYLTLDKEHVLTQTIYYTPSFGKASDIKEVEDVIKYATREQALADVPVALLFSGGLDSSILAGHLGADTKSLFFESDRVETQAAGMADDKFYAEEITKRLGLDLELIKSDNAETVNFLKEIDHIAAMVEEPISDYTFIASEKLCKEARKHGYKVVISGMGGDEAFGGYPRYILAKNYKFFKNIRLLLQLSAPLLSRAAFFAKKFQRLLSFLKEKSFAMGYVRLIGYLSTKEINALLKEPLLQQQFEVSLNDALKKHEDLPHLKQAIMLDYSGFLSHNLMVADKSSMLASVEMRVPLLDVDVYQAGIEQASEDLISGKQQKLILQKILKRLLPTKLVSRQKTGFNPPLDNKINQLGEKVIKEILSSGPISRHLNFDEIQSIVKQHFLQKKNNTFKIWQFLFLNAWLTHWSEN